MVVRLILALHPRFCSSAIASALALALSLNASLISLAAAARSLFLFRWILLTFNRLISCPLALCCGSDDLDACDAVGE